MVAQEAPELTSYHRHTESMAHVEQFLLTEIQKLAELYTHQVNWKITTSEWEGKAEKHSCHEPHPSTVTYNGKSPHNYPLLSEEGRVWTQHLVPQLLPQGPSLNT